MTRAEVQEEALKLPREERATLMEALHMSLFDEPLTDRRQQLLDERIAEDDRDPEGALPGAELLAWLRKPSGS